MTFDDWLDMHIKLAAEKHQAIPDKYPKLKAEWRTRLVTLEEVKYQYGMRYTYLGDKLTADPLRGLQCDPVRRADGRCIVSVKMATALVIDRAGNRYVVARRRLRVNTTAGSD